MSNLALLTDYFSPDLFLSQGKAMAGELAIGINLQRAPQAQLPEAAPITDSTSCKDRTRLQGTAYERSGLAGETVAPPFFSDETRIWKRQPGSLLLTCPQAPIESNEPSWCCPRGSPLPAAPCQRRFTGSKGLVPTSSGASRRSARPAPGQEVAKAC